MTLSKTEYQYMFKKTIKSKVIFSKLLRILSLFEFFQRIFVSCCFMLEHLLFLLAVFEYY
jgi:hypothetical protein